MAIGYLMNFFNQISKGQEVLYLPKQTSGSSITLSSSIPTKCIEPSLENRKIVQLNSKEIDLDLNDTQSSEASEETDAERLNGIKEKIRGIVIEKEKFFPLHAEALLLVGVNQILYTNRQLLQELKLSYQEIVEKHLELTDDAKKYFKGQIDRVSKLIEKYGDDSEDPNEFIGSLHEIVHAERQGLDLIQKMEWLESIYSVLSIRAKTEKQKSYYKNKMNYTGSLIEKMNNPEISPRGTLAEQLRKALKTRQRTAMEEELNQYYKQK